MHLMELTLSSFPLDAPITQNHKIDKPLKITKICLINLLDGNQIKLNINSTKEK